MICEDMLMAKLIYTTLGARGLNVMWQVPGTGPDSNKNEDIPVPPI
jgi:hypothetical protein